MKRRRFAEILFATMLATAVAAQDGVSTASAARAKHLGNRGELPASREIAVEEFVNYHRHELPRPKAGQAVAMDVRWGNDMVREGRQAILQIGLSTALANDRQHLRPLNLALVIDKSGSMADHDKLERVKQALLILVSQLRDADTLSLVTFDTSAQVLFPARRLGDREEVNRIIRDLRPGSSTNMEAGLVLGYKEVIKHFDRESTNRVILLTDGIANQGVTDPKEISSESQCYNDRGVDLSTIGVGEDLNKDLLRDLAKSGRGLFHFVADDEDIQKVFVKELQSLLSPVAQNPDLVIDYDPALHLEQIYGYEPKLAKNSARIRLDTMNSGMTQVVLLRFKLPTGEDRATSFPVKVHLTYRDLDRAKAVTLNDVSVLKLADTGGRGELDDASVAKNTTIADLAQSIKDMAAAYEAKNLSQAESLVATTVARTIRRYPNLEDADIKRTFDIAVKYRDLLRERVPAEDRARNDDRPTPSVRDFPDAPSHGPNLVPNGDFSQGNTGFVSDRKYIKPSPNCLWGGYYTVVPGFNSPEQLHTNVASQPFSAPHGGNVMFMNTGGADQFVYYSTRVKVKAHTKYRISFQEIGLSGGQEWTNTYEIRLGKDRSEPQLGGIGKYVEVSYEWDSGASTSATLSIVRLPNPHSGGVVGISNIVMVAK